LKLDEKKNKLKESTTAKEVLKAIEKHGGIKSFPVKDRKDRPVGCPMKRMLKQEFQKLSNEEVHIGFNLGLISTEDKK